jgi:thiosulfate/3-mercaptopyruvate sulfurtransferase
MKKRLLLSVCFILLNIPLFAQKDKSILVTPDWLSERINDDNLVLLHVDNEKAFNNSHIPGAQFISWKEYTYEDEDQVFDLPSTEGLKEMFQNKGINNNSLIVLYVESNWIPMMSRVYLTLDYLGLSKNVYLLDGGLALWKVQGRTTSTEITEPKTGDFTVNIKENLIVNADYVQEAINNPNINIVDGRAAVYYQGIEAGNGGKSRKGRIPGAKTIPFTSLFEKKENGSFTFLVKNDLEKIFKDQGLDKTKELLLYCHIGMQLSAVYVVAKHLGYKHVKVYDGSFYEWGPDESLPIEL